MQQVHEDQTSEENWRSNQWSGWLSQISLHNVVTKTAELTVHRNLISGTISGSVKILFIQWPLLDLLAIQN